MEYVYVIVDRVRGILEGHVAVFAKLEDACFALKKNWPPEQGYKYNHDGTVARYTDDNGNLIHKIEISEEKVRVL